MLVSQSSTASLNALSEGLIATTSASCHASTHFPHLPAVDRGFQECPAIDEDNEGNNGDQDQDDCRQCAPDSIYFQ
jgi:hypothetical protein